MRFSLLVFSILSVVLLNSCSTDVETNAEYKDITIVYGLLDPDSTTHYIKINKAFLGDGNANDLAADANNTNYSDGEINVKIDAYSSTGAFVKSYGLTRTTNDLPKEDGIFDNSTNVLYKFTEPGLDVENTYKLSIYNPSISKEVTAETTLPKGASVQIFNSLKFINSSGSYSSETFIVSPKENVGRVRADLVFRYVEIYETTGGCTPQDSIQEIIIPMGEQKATSLNGNNLEFTLSGEVFFNTIASHVDVNKPCVRYRRINNAQLKLTYAGLDLSTYISVNSPSNNSSAEFTNINNGLGVFSSRTIDIEVTPAVQEDVNATNFDGQLNLDNNTIKQLTIMGLEFCNPRKNGFNVPPPYCW